MYPFPASILAVLFLFTAVALTKDSSSPLAVTTTSPRASDSNKQPDNAQDGLILTPPPLLALALPPTQLIPNPQTLPARTYASLTAANFSTTAPFRRAGTFEFRDIPAGEYLCEVWTRDFVFVPMRVDVQDPTSGGSGEKEGKKRVEVWQTFRGNEWGNKGERLGGGEGNIKVNVGVLTQRSFYEVRTGFSPLSLLKNPMILIGVFGTLVMFGMPKIMENMDPEMKKEFEEHQKASPLATGLTSGNPMGGFDMAAWMAGSSSDGPAGRSSGAQEGGGGNARRRG